MELINKFLFVIEDITRKLDEFVNEGYNLNSLRDQMTSLVANPDTIFPRLLPSHSFDVRDFL